MFRQPLTLPHAKHIEQLLQRLCAQPPRSRPQLRRSSCRCAACRAGRGTAPLAAGTRGQAKVSGRLAYQPVRRLS